MDNQNQFYAQESAGISWLSNLTQYPPAFLDMSGNKVMLEPKQVKDKNGECYYCNKKQNGHFSLTYSTYQGGGATHTFNSWVHKPDTQITFTQADMERINQARQQAILKSEQEKKERAERLEKTANEYLAASTNGLNNLFRSKGVQSHAHAINGLKYNDGVAYMPIVDKTGKTQGFQTISTAGKKYVHGNVAGGFILLGDLPEKSTKPVQIYVCEGVTTGLSVHMATCGVVLCAINAGNYISAIMAFRTFSRSRKLKIQLHICADNDQWKDSNTGIIAANNAAMMTAQNAFITCPTGLNEGLTDFNDLHATQGLWVVKEQIEKNARRVNPMVAFQKYLAKQTKEPSTTSRYIGDIALKDGVNLIKSGVGTGKTQALLKYSKIAESFLYISHLQSLTTDAAIRLVLDSYKEVDNSQMHHRPHLAICVNSLGKLAYNQMQVPNYEYVVIDEIEQLLQRLTTAFKGKKMVIRLLKIILMQAKRIVLLDAHLGKRTKRFIKNLLGKDIPINEITHDYKVGTGRTVTLYDDPDTLLDKASQALNHGKKVFLTCNSKREVKRAYKLLEKSFPQNAKEIIQITGDNTGDDDSKALFKDVNNAAESYKCIIVSPVANTGLSIDSKRGKAAFDFVGGIFKNDVNMPTDCLQALGRVRDTKEVHVYIEAKPSQRYATARDYGQILNAFTTQTKETDGYELEPEYTDDGLICIDVNEAYTQLCADVQHTKEKAHAHFFRSVTFELAKDGYSFQWYYSNDVELKEARKQGKEAKERSEQQYYNDVLDAPSIDKNAFEKLGRKQALRQVETDAMTRYRIEQYYEPFVPIEQAVEMDKYGKFQDANQRLAWGLLTNEQAGLLQEKQKSRLKADREKIKAQKTLFSELLLAVEQPHHKDSEGIKAFSEHVISNRADYENLGFSIDSDDMLRANPFQFSGKLLRHIGLETKTSRIRKEGERTYIRTLNSDHFTLCQAIAQQRIERLLEKD